MTNHENEDMSTNDTKKRLKKRWIVIGIIIVLLLGAAIGGNKGDDSTEAQNSQPFSQVSTPAESKLSSEDPEPNTSAKVDALAREAKRSVADGVTDEMRDEAIAFIVEYYPDFYRDNNIMEKAMSYGFWLEYAYKENKAARNYCNLGMDVEQAVKYVYRGAEKPEDEATVENLRQIKESLEAIGWTVE